jgi:hypothetical protein
LPVLLTPLNTLCRLIFLFPQTDNFVESTKLILVLVPRQQFEGIALGVRYRSVIRVTDFL